MTRLNLEPEKYAGRSVSGRVSAHGRPWKAHRADRAPDGTSRVGHEQRITPLAERIWTPDRRRQDSGRSTSRRDINGIGK
jgi:hypothetical protein